MPISFFNSWSPGRWLGISITVFVIVVAAGACFTFFDLPKIYEAHAQVRLTQDGGEPALQAAVKRMDSPEFLFGIVSDLALDRTWAKDMDGRNTANVLEPKDSYLYMRRLLRIGIRPDLGTIVIHVSSQRAKEAADIANAIADRYEAVTELEYHQRIEQLPNVTDSQLNARPIEIVLRAEAPTSPSKPNNILNLVIAAWAGAIVGGLIGVLVEWLIWQVAKAAEIVKDMERKPPAPAEY